MRTTPTTGSSTSLRRPARVCICPTTEANLGDGLAPLERLRERGIGTCIGSDSNVRIDPLEAASWRTTARRRTLSREVVDAGDTALLGADEGAASLGLESWPDTAVDLEHRSLRGVDPDVLDALVFGCGADVFVESWRAHAGGSHQVVPLGRLEEHHALALRPEPEHDLAAAVGGPPAPSYRVKAADLRGGDDPPPALIVTTTRLIRRTRAGPSRRCAGAATRGCPLRRSSSGARTSAAGEVAHVVLVVGGDLPPERSAVHIQRRGERRSVRGVVGPHVLDRRREVLAVRHEHAILLRAGLRIPAEEQGCRRCVRPARSARPSSA